MELTKIRGINLKREQELNGLGIFDTSDLIRHFPRAYLDMRSSQSLKYAYHNDIVLTSGTVVSTPAVRYYRRGSMVKITCEQEGFLFSVSWYNQPYVVSKIEVGNEYLFYGRVRIENGITTLTNPSFEPCDKVFRLQGIVPQYKIKGSLTQKVMRDAIRLSVNLEKPSSIIPISLQKKYNLMDLYSAYREVHNPTSIDVNKASERIAIEEYFALISAFKMIKGGKEQIRTNRYNCSFEQVLSFIKERYPFEFTDGQKSAVKELFNDMKSDLVMNRLMQGDVGSGKTAVSTCVVYMAVSSGYQVVMLSPTEVLAEQNFNVLKKVFPEYNVAFLSGSLTAKQKKIIKSEISSGLAQIVVGTHAVLTDDVEFKNLSLCICDEQQRFGVGQRSKLLAKGKDPDVLVMSATPIPRTLSLIFYGDLNITTISDKPKSRIEIQTNIVPSNKYDDMLEFIKNQTLLNCQAYFVCPKIDGDEEGEVISATELYEEIKCKLPTVSVGLLHGKMKNDEKNAVMKDFKDKRIMLLVSTTVIEVGIDVPDATVMVIYNAERFGLSALHQLRGRVGRSDKKSYCFLMTSSNNSDAIERLIVVKNNTDGFKISEYDYKMRGGGDFMGSRQSGKFMNDLGCLNYGTDCIFLAKKISDQAFELGIDTTEIKKVAQKKYDRLKDIALN